MVSIRKYVKKFPRLHNLLSGVNKALFPLPPAITGTNNIISNNGRFTNVEFNIVGNDNEISIGNNTFLNNTLIYIRGDNHRLLIEEDCFFEGELWIEDDNCSLIIRKGTSIERAHLAVTERGSKLEIQQDCMLARHIEIRTGDSHSIIDLQTGKRINQAADILLKEHVWVGAHAKILKGVTIGNNSVIATASLVTSDIPPHTIAGGVPAKVIRENVDWKRERLAGD